MASASRVFGEELERHLGWLEPSPEEQIVPTADGETIQLGDMRFTAVETLGHASHHHAWLLEVDGERHVFSGDTAGMRVPGTTFVTLPLVAPELDPVAWSASIDRVRALQADRLWLTHFGPVEEQDDFLANASARLHAETAFLRSLLETSEDEAQEALVGRYRRWHAAQARAHGIDPTLLEHHCSDLHYEANLAGAKRWLIRAGN